MMGTFLKQTLIGAVALAAGILPGAAADVYEPPVYQAPPPVYREEPVDFGGWYIRGDLDYHANKFRGGDYITYGPPPGTDDFDTASVGSSWSVGGDSGVVDDAGAPSPAVRFRLAWTSATVAGRPSR